MKKIIHVDMDCFYAQVEMRDNPSLRDVPLAIGGLPGTRSVLCTSNYIARKFGVKSAMPTDYAVKLCPGLVVLPPNFRKYSEASEIIQSVFHKYSAMVEPLSLDEAFLDVSDYENATELAKTIKKEIFARTGLTASVGVAPNKFLAKVASDWKKPDGLFVIPPNHVENFVKALPVKLIPGVGKKGHEVMESLGIKTCEDLRNIPHEILMQFFGKFSYDLHLYSRGIDDRDVVSEWERKSLSVETTFSKDIVEENILQLELKDLYEEMISRLEAHMDEEGEKKIKKIFVKIKFNDFQRTTCEETLKLTDLDDWRDCISPPRFFPLLSHCLQKRGNAIRLIGLGVRFVTQEEHGHVQLSLLPYCG
ncbi:MAG: DNA polymerase IV [Bacteriovorax sp.]|jgi:DNA polymerase-4